MGIPENLACVCWRCHEELDHGMHRKEYQKVFRDYLEKHYPGFPDDKRRFDKWRH